MERLNKYLAHAGVGSRRHCDDLIRAGRIKINGRVVTDLGIKVDTAIQKVAVDDQPIKAEKLVYWVVHKPPGVLCTNHDPSRRPLAIDLIPHVEQRVYTVGRLDEASEGLLLMTNDGELANELMHPRYGVEKTYLVQVAGKPSPQDLDQLTEGVWLSDGKVKAKSAKRVRSQDASTWVRIVLSEGKNREIRRMLAKLEHKVLRLRRIAIGPVQLDRLPKGKARKLSLGELEELRETIKLRKKKSALAPHGAGGEDEGDAMTGPGLVPVVKKRVLSLPKPGAPATAGARPPKPTGAPKPDGPRPMKPVGARTPRPGPRPPRDGAGPAPGAFAGPPGSSGARPTVRRTPRTAPPSPRGRTPR